MKSKITILVTVLSLSTMASVLPKKTKMVRVGSILSESNALWIGDDLTAFGGETKRSALSTTLLYGVGLGRGWQLDANAMYSKAELKNGDLDTASEGDSESGLTSIGLTLKKQLSKRRSKHSLVTDFGFTAPGSSNSYESEEMFLAINDGSTNVHAGLQYSYRFSKLLALDSLLKYTHRFEARKPDQLRANLGLNISFKKFGLIPFMNYLQSFGGVNIGGTQFKNRSAVLGRGRFVFSQKREKVIGFGLNSYVVLTPTFVLDAFYQFTADGENTDKAKNFGLGISKFF